MTTLDLDSVQTEQGELRDLTASDTGTRRPWIQSRTARIGAAAVVVAALSSIGYASGHSKVPALRSKLATTSRELTDMQAKLKDSEELRSAATATATDLQTRLDTADATVKSQAAELAPLKAQKAQVDQEAAQLAQQKQAQDAKDVQQAQQSQQLASQSQALASQQAAADASSFSDGVFQVGRDIQRGQYHTTGAPECYWAKLNSSVTSDIGDNNLGSGPQTVVIDTPYFKSDGCGTWTKIG